MTTRAAKDNFCYISVAGVSPLQLLGCEGHSRTTERKPKKIENLLMLAIFVKRNFWILEGIINDIFYTLNGEKHRCILDLREGRKRNNFSKFSWGPLKGQHHEF